MAEPDGQEPSSAAIAPRGPDRRWLILVTVAIAQLMVVLDATIVNIALPSAQRDLGFANADRQWVVTAYALAFGGLLLLGGRVGDLFARKRVFIVGLLGFAVASALGGAATSFGLLVTARALQGSFGAILTPAALGTLLTTFTDPRERQRARWPSSAPPRRPAVPGSTPWAQSWAAAASSCWCSASRAPR